MKRYVWIIYLMLVCARLSAYTRYSPEMDHYISLNGDLGFSTMVHTMPNQGLTTGVNTNLGIAYRLFRNNYVFSTGLEAMYQLSANSLRNLNVDLTMRDTEGDIFIMHAIIDDTRDNSHMLNLNIPLLMGGEWGRFYFMVGPKLSVNLYGAAETSARYTTYGAYERYYDYFYDMPNHQFESDQVMKSGLMRVKWNMNVLAHLEIGGRVTGSFDTRSYKAAPDIARMYLAVYADFGILNLHSGGTGLPPFEYRETPDKGVQFYVQPLLMSSVSDGAVFRNLNIGIKYTIAFSFKRGTKSYRYDWHRVNNNYRKRGGSQIIVN